jgi:signal transduction histidine kinase
MVRLNIHVDISGREHALDETIKITVFRIIQEALTNIIKHSRATSARVNLEYREKAVYILVRDNGIGFDMDAVESRIGRVSLGLAGMAERAALLGGTVEVHSRPDYGTEVEAVIPYGTVKKEEQ